MILGINKVEIIGINDSAEWIEIKNNRISSVDMTSWKLEDNATAGGSIHTFIFPSFVLSAGSTVKIYSGDAYNNCNATVATLCWSNASIWNADHDVATLKDVIGNIAATYSY